LREDIVVGDLLKIKLGMEVPADGIVVEANDLMINESSMTGETH
jgi:P-type E1-E2 ATPase